MTCTFHSLPNSTITRSIAARSTMSPTSLARAALVCAVFAWSALIASTCFCSQSFARRSAEMPLPPTRCAGFTLRPFCLWLSWSALR